MEIEIKKKIYSYEADAPFYKGSLYDAYIATDKKGKKVFLALPHEGKYEEFLKEKNFLKKIGVDNPKIKKADKAACAVLMKYSDVAAVEELLCIDELNDEVYQEAFRLAKFARLSKVTLDFKPEHFFMGRKGMLYFGTENFPLKQEERFEQKAIYLWVHGKEGLAYLKSRGHDIEGIVPIKEEEMKRHIVLLVVKDYQ